MLRQALQGARWYQHVAPRSSSISRPSLRAFSAIAPRSLDYGGPNDKVNFYEQTTRQSKDRRKIDPEEEEKAERDEVEGELSRLDRELAVIKEGPFSPNSPFMKSLPEKDRAIALEALRKHEEQEGGSQNEPDTGLDQVFDGELDDLIKEEFGNMAQEEENWQADAETDESLSPVEKHPFEITLPDSTSHPYVERLNKCLRLFASDPSDDLLRQEIWRWYRRCKQSCSGFLESMPGEAVDLIWASQATGRVNMATRTAHMQTLVDDAESIGRILSTPHTLSYIESLHDGGNATEALEQWEANQEGFSRSMEDVEAYWKLGVRLYAAENNPQRAQSIALAFLASDKREPRVLVPVITAWGRQPGEQAEVSAWKLYLQLKTLLGSNMTMEDYDHISIGLLKAGRLDTALAVFKDMMVTYQDPAKDSTALYKAALGLAGNLQASSITEQDVNKVSLSALTLLPNRFQNRFFYASWLKKLIGMGEVDSAALVIELMYERGVKPDSKHLNGMIAAWFREGAPSSRDKAEQLGWAMIQQRVDMAWTRIDASTKSPRVHEDKELDTARIPKWMQREVPAGTIETFSILLLHYSRRSDDDMIRYLTKCLGDAQLQPNSFFMNHLLYAELRRHNLGAVWHKYRTMTESIKPDLETYACLWDSGKVQYDLGRKASHGDFPSARGIYAEMMAWYADHLSPRGRAVTQEQFSKDLYDQIIRCFCFSKDLPGTIVALYSMGLEFSLFPDDVTARMVVLQVARMAGVPPNTPSRRLRRLSSTPRSKENIAYVNRLLEILSSRKAATLESQGLSIDTLDPLEKQQYQLEILAMLLRVVMSRKAAEPERIEDEIAAVAREMGVPGIYLGSPLGRDESLLQ